MELTPQESNLIKEQKTPQELEKELINKELSPSGQAEEDPAAIAAGMFGIYLPRFLSLVWKLSSKGRARVLCALIESPLNEKPYNFYTKEEKECFAVGEALLQAKFMLVQASFMEHSEELANAINPSVEVTEETKGESNG